MGLSTLRGNPASQASHKSPHLVPPAKPITLKGLLRAKLAPLSQRKGAYPGEDWQTDFTQRPPYRGFKYLLVFVDAFTHWVEAFPYRTEKAAEVFRRLLEDITSCFSLPQSSHGDNGPALASQETLDTLQVARFLQMLQECKLLSKDPSSPRPVSRGT